LLNNIIDMFNLVVNQRRDLRKLSIDNILDDSMHPVSNSIQGTTSQFD
jgi:hypothetical protein